MITPALLAQAIESFPLSYDNSHCAATVSEQDLELANQLIAAFGQCEPFHGMSAQLRESYFYHGMQIWAWVNIARVWMQLGYRLHSLEQMEALK